MAVGGSAGVWLFDDAFEQIAHLEMEAVWQVAWRPDGVMLAVSMRNGAVQLWTVNDDARESALLWILADADLPDDYTARDISWSPDGTMLAMADTEGEGAVIVDFDSGDVVLTLPGVDSRVAWSRDGEFIAGIIQYDKIGLWNAHTWQPLRTFHSDMDYLIFLDLAINPDGRYLAATSGPATLHIWDLETGLVVNNPEETFDDSAGMSNVAWRPDGNMLITADRSYSSPGFAGINVFDATSWNYLGGLGFRDDLRAAVWQPDGSHITGVSAAGVLRNWSPKTRLGEEYPLFSDEPNLLKWNFDNVQLAVTGNFRADTTVQVWRVDQDVSGNVFIPPHTIVDRIVDTIDWIPGTQTLVTISHGTFVSAYYHTYGWDVETDESVWPHLELFEQFGPAMTVDWDSGYSRHAIHWFRDNEVDIVSGDQERLTTLITEQPFVNNIAWSPDDSMLATISIDTDSEDAVLEIFDLASQERVASMKLAEQYGHSLLWSPDSTHLMIYTRGDDATLAIINPDGSVIMERDDLPHVTAAWRPDSTAIALLSGAFETGYDIMTVNLGDDEPALVLHSDRQMYFDWHPDGDVLAINADDRLHLWDSAAGEMLETVDAPGVEQILWSPDGEKLALVGDDDRIRIWRIDMA